MPVLSKFYGIIIRMLCVRSLSPRFYAIYGDQELVVEIAPLRIVAGDAPLEVRSRVLAWAARHQDELLAAWRRIAHAQRPAPIAPWA